MLAHREFDQPVLDQRNLNGFDHFVMRHLKPGSYLRYVDALAPFRNDKDHLWACLAEIETYLPGRCA